MSSITSLNTPLLLGAVLLYQCVLVQGLGLCPLGGKSHDPRRVLPVAIALAAATASAIFATALIRIGLLAPNGLDYFAGYVAIVCVALSTQAAVALLQRMQPFTADDRVPDKRIPLLLTQIAALGVTLAFDDPEHGVLNSLQNALLGGLLFASIYVLSTAVRERLLLSEIPTPFRGAAIHVLTAGLAALALMGLAGLF